MWWRVALTSSRPPMNLHNQEVFLHYGVVIYDPLRQLLGGAVTGARGDQLINLFMEPKFAPKIPINFE